MRNDITVSYNYGAWSLKFFKTFTLPFVPFVGLTLDDSTTETENRIELTQYEYATTEIDFDNRRQMFFIEVRNIWNRPVSDETIDDIIDRFKKTGWNRMDDTDVNMLKDLMAQEIQ